MRTWIGAIFGLTAFLLALTGLGCENPRKVDCDITGLVVDAGTDMPIDSARVYVTYVPYSMERRFICLTDAAGHFSLFVGCDDLHVVEVEKDGYLKASMVIRNGDARFALQPIVSSDNNRAARS